MRMVYVIRIVFFFFFLSTSLRGVKRWWWKVQPLVHEVCLNSTSCFAMWLHSSAFFLHYMTTDNKSLCFAPTNGEWSMVSYTCISGHIKHSDGPCLLVLENATLGPTQVNI